MEVKAELSRIVINETVDQQIIVLKEIDGSRSFPVVIGINEILAIDRRLKNIALPRPMTHDLLANVIKKMDAEIEKIVVSDLSEHTFYAVIHIVKSDGQKVQIDSRPSDAIAVGVGLGAPLYIDEQVFEKMNM
jgi:hypothetical protein